MATTKEYPAGKRGLAPPHPGAMWRGIISDGLGISISEAAARMAVSRQQLHRILSGDNPVTPNFALRFSRLCGKGDDGAAFWLRLQNSYDLWHARRAMKNELKAVRPVRAKKAAASA